MNNAPKNIESPEEIQSPDVQSVSENQEKKDSITKAMNDFEVHLEKSENGLETDSNAQVSALLKNNEWGITAIPEDEEGIVDKTGRYILLDANGERLGDLYPPTEDGGWGFSDRFSGMKSGLSAEDVHTFLRTGQEKIEKIKQSQQVLDNVIGNIVGMPGCETTTIEEDYSRGIVGIQSGPYKGKWSIGKTLIVPRAGGGTAKVSVYHLPNAKEGINWAVSSKVGLGRDAAYLSRELAQETAAKAIRNISAPKQ